MIAIIYGVIAVSAFAGVAFVLMNDDMSYQLVGISIYKIPLIFINSAVILYASYKAFKLSSRCILWYLFSIFIYFIIGTYDQFIRYGSELFSHIMVDFHYSVGIRVLSVMLLYVAFSSLNAANQRN